MDWLSGDVSNDGGLDVLLASHSDIAAENGLVVLTNTGTAPTSTITTPSTSIFITNTNTLLFGGTASTRNAVTLGSRYRWRTNVAISERNCALEL